MKLAPGVLGLALVVCASGLSAQIVTYTIDGTINSVSNAATSPDLAAAFMPGETFELKFTGDASTGPSFSLPGLGLYAFDLLSGQITVGANTFAFDSSSIGLFQGFGATTLGFGGASFLNTFTVTASLGSSNDLLPQGAFPSPLPPLSAFDLSNQFTVEAFTQQTDNFEALGEITSIQVVGSPVPEPATYSLAAVAMLGLGAFIRRRRAT